MEQSSTKKIKLVLHGSLRDRFPYEIFVIAETPYEAIRAMCHEHSQFHNLRLDERPTVQVLGCPTVYSLREPIVGDELHLVPAFAGAGGNATKIVIGAILMAVSVFYLQPEGFALGASMAMGMGASLALGGVLGYLSPAPKRDSNSVADPEASKYLGATINTTKIGTRIPIIYGKVRAGGHYISFDVKAADVAV